MEIDQISQKKVSFLLVLALVGAALMVNILLAYFFVNFQEQHLGMRNDPAHPTSQLILPLAYAPITRA